MITNAHQSTLFNLEKLLWLRIKWNEKNTHTKYIHLDYIWNWTVTHIYAQLHDPIIWWKPAHLVSAHTVDKLLTKSGNWSLQNCQTEVVSQSPPWQSVTCDQKEICCKSSIVESFGVRSRQKSKYGGSLNVKACNNRLLRMYGSHCLWNIFVPFYQRRVPYFGANKCSNWEPSHQC